MSWNSAVSICSWTTFPIHASLTASPEAATYRLQQFSIIAEILQLKVLVAAKFAFAIAADGNNKLSSRIGKISTTWHNFHNM